MGVPDPLTELLCAWCRDVASVPVPILVDPARAVRVLRHAARVHASPDDARTRVRDR
ncbi:hypothetical protein [Amycolatopsis sp. PS_44_ISF1]|uniref:hypothetical protein n=1 Tax=Amycolatopsis sp. PS_44_ISF1 TaxID=2974917 RepID=UPI0028DF5520|nr:hypothetical protein [Amycolatopsis sp. PS_44_ISF1]MDT8911090.1 hypothetical protein [Amycolatopsis sp. PS_44_ISF1]